MEMWALFNFCAPDVLGEPADFKWVGWQGAWHAGGLACMGQHYRGPCLPACMNAWLCVASRDSATAMPAKLLCITAELHCTALYCRVQGAVREGHHPRQRQARHAVRAGAGGAGGGAPATGDGALHAAPGEKRSVPGSGGHPCRRGSGGSSSHSRGSGSCWRSGGGGSGWRRRGCQAGGHASQERPHCVAQAAAHAAQGLSSLPQLGWVGGVVDSGCWISGSRCGMLMGAERIA
jgi:hypothetical protein